MGEPLADAEIEQGLRELPDWRRDGDSLVRVVHAPDFATGIRIVDAVAEAAERANHHPDIDIRWTDATYRLSTHAVGSKITANDLALARSISDIARQHGAS
jgi:4a-hydroxytetrahydrobiopterin dehydratase